MPYFLFYIFKLYLFTAKLCSIKMEKYFIGNNSKGFTILELAIAVLVIGLLMNFAMKGESIIDSVKRKSDMQKINKLYTAVSVYHSTYDKLP